MVAGFPKFVLPQTTYHLSWVNKRGESLSVSLPLNETEFRLDDVLGVRPFHITTGELSSGLTVV